MRLSVLPGLMGLQGGAEGVAGGLDKWAAQRERQQQADTALQIEMMKQGFVPGTPGGPPIPPNASHPTPTAAGHPLADGLYAHQPLPAPGTPPTPSVPELHPDWTGPQDPNEIPPPAVTAPPVAPTPQPQVQAPPPAVAPRQAIGPQPGATLAGLIAPPTPPAASVAVPQSLNIGGRSFVQDLNSPVALGRAATLAHTKAETESANSLTADRLAKARLDHQMFPILKQISPTHPLVQGNVEEGAAKAVDELFKSQQTFKQDSVKSDLDFQRQKKLAEIMRPQMHNFIEPQDPTKVHYLSDEEGAKQGWILQTTGGASGSQSLSPADREKMMAQARIDNATMKSYEADVLLGKKHVGLGTGLAGASAAAHGGVLKDMIGILGNTATGELDADYQKYLTAQRSYGRIMGNLQSKRYTDNQAEIERSISGLQGNDLNSTILYKQQLRDASLGDPVAQSSSQRTTASPLRAKYDAAVAHLKAQGKTDAQVHATLGDPP